MTFSFIHSRTRKEHLGHICTALSRLGQCRLYVSPRKHYFMTRETEFWGLLVSEEGILVHSEATNVNKHRPKPINITELRSFHGFVQFFQRFIPLFFRRAVPLVILVKKNSSLKDWNGSTSAIFVELKHGLVSGPVLNCTPLVKALFCSHRRVENSRGSYPYAV